MSATDILRIIGDVSSVAIVPLAAYGFKIYNLVYEAQLSIEPLRTEIYANFERAKPNER